MKRQAGTTVNLRQRPPKREKLEDEDRCHVCDLSESESCYPEYLNWHGCNCDRWYHAVCTPFKGKTPKDFSCQKVNAKFGADCTARRPNVVPKKEPIVPKKPVVLKKEPGFLPPIKKEIKAASKLGPSPIAFPDSTPGPSSVTSMPGQSFVTVPSSISGAISVKKNWDSRFATTDTASKAAANVTGKTSASIAHKPITQKSGSLILNQMTMPMVPISPKTDLTAASQPSISLKSDMNCPSNHDATITTVSKPGVSQSAKLSVGSHPAKEGRSNTSVIQFEPQNLENSFGNMELDDQALKTHPKNARDDKQTEINENTESPSGSKLTSSNIGCKPRTGVQCILPGKKGYAWNPWVAFNLAADLNLETDFQCEPSSFKEDNCLVNTKTKTDLAKIDIVIESVINFSDGVNEERIEKSNQKDTKELKQTFTFKKISRENIVTNEDRGSPVADFDIFGSGASVDGLNTPVVSRNNSGSEFCTPSRYENEEIQNSQPLEGENPTGKKLTNQGLRTNKKRILPAKTIAAFLKHRDPKAYAQYCLETDPVEDVPRVPRKKNGPTFPTAEEIEMGAKEYDVPAYRSYGRRAPTIVTKVQELCEGALCADAVIDIIPNFDSKSKLVERLTFISKGYFKAAELNGGQLGTDELPAPVRASSIELPKNVMLPSGPIPEQDTGALERPEKEIKCEICHREYGSDEDNEFADFLLGCWADRLCSSSKMYHLSCYFPQARVICDYDKADEVHKFRKLVYCSRTCMLLANKRDAVDTEGLKLGKGRRKKANIENED